MDEFFFISHDLICIKVINIDFETFLRNQYITPLSQAKTGVHLQLDGLRQCLQSPLCNFRMIPVSTHRAISDL